MCQTPPLPVNSVSFEVLRDGYPSASLAHVFHINHSHFLQSLLKDKLFASKLPVLGFSRFDKLPKRINFQGG